MANDSWQQEQFVLSTFHAVPADAGDELPAILNACKEAGLTHVETAFSARPAILRALDICDEIGLKVIVQDLGSLSGFQDRTTSAATPETVAEAVKTYGAHRSVDGYYIWDEPFFEQLDFAAENTRLIRQYAPGKLQLIALLQSYSPDYHWENGLFPRYIDTFIERTDPSLLSFDYYVFDHDVDKGVSLEDSYLWTDMAYIRKKALENGIPYWYYLQLIGDIIGHQPDRITLERVRVQTGIALAFGASGIQYFNILDGILTKQGERMKLFDPVAALNREVLSLGEALFGKESTLVYPSGRLLHREYLDSPADSPLVAGAPDGLFIGEFTDEASDYLLAVNLDYEQPRTGEIRLRQTRQAAAFDPGSKTYGAPERTAALAYNLPAGGYRLYRFAK